MSKGTRYTQQSYKVSNAFPFEWIKKKWKENFYITGMATAGLQAWLECCMRQQPLSCSWLEMLCGCLWMSISRVLSILAGSCFFAMHACLNCNDLEAWNTSRAVWRACVSQRLLSYDMTAVEHLIHTDCYSCLSYRHIACACATGKQWAVVMSRCNEYKDQVIELDFLYPSDGIHRRWDEGATPAYSCPLPCDSASHPLVSVLRLCIVPLYCAACAVCVHKCLGEDLPT